MAKVGRPSVLTPAEWETVKQARIAGTPRASICQVYPSLTMRALEKAEARGGWPTPEKLARESRNAAIAEMLTDDDEPSIDAPEIYTIPSLSGNMSQITQVGEKKDKSAIQITLDAAKEVGNSCLSGLVHRAAPVLDRWTPPAPADIYEGAALAKLVRSAAGLDQRGGAQINVQVNVGPWGKPRSEAFRDVPESQ